MSEYRDRETAPLLTAAFPDAVPGRVGCWVWKARSSFDNVTVWDQTVLP